jgi:hypothetical protein
MFVVMAPAATEDQINSVKSHILAEGLSAHENRGLERVVIAALGGVGPRK